MTTDGSVGRPDVRPRSRTAQHLRMFSVGWTLLLAVLVLLGTAKQGSSQDGTASDETKVRVLTHLYEPESGARVACVPATLSGIDLSGFDKFQRADEDGLCVIKRPRQEAGDLVIYGAGLGFGIARPNWGGETELHLAQIGAKVSGLITEGHGQPAGGVELEVMNVRVGRRICAVRSDDEGMFTTPMLNTRWLDDQIAIRVHRGGRAREFDPATGSELMLNDVVRNTPLRCWSGLVEIALGERLTPAITLASLGWDEKNGDDISRLSRESRNALFVRSWSGRRVGGARIHRARFKNQQLVYLESEPAGTTDERGLWRVDVPMKDGDGYLAETGSYFGLSGTVSGGVATITMDRMGPRISGIVRVVTGGSSELRIALVSSSASREFSCEASCDERGSFVFPVMGLDSVERVDRIELRRGPVCLAYVACDARTMLGAARTVEAVIVQGRGATASIRQGFVEIRLE